MATKPFILFIVEGVSDKDALEAIVNELTDTDIKCHVVGGDLTSRDEINVSNILKKIKDEINKFFKNKNMVKSYITNGSFLKIIHIVDIDGIYINDDLIIEDENVNQFVYENNCIIANKKDNVIARNKKKRDILDKLSSIKEIAKTNYELYFFSSNLDHVLHNEMNLEEKLKCSYADKFTDKYTDDIEGFIEFINDKSIVIDGDYKTSWDNIKKETNQIKRCTNFHLCVNDLKTLA